MKVLTFVDEKLNGLPMYKVVGYVLFVYAVLSFILSLTGLISYSFLSLFYSLATILISGFAVNFIFTKIKKLPSNYESVLITCLILFLILAPIESLTQVWETALIVLFAIASKYLLVWRKTHLFNPAAFGAFMSYIFGFGISFWWVGSMYFLPFVILGGLLIARKTRKEEVIFVAMFASVATLFLYSFIDGNTFLESFKSMYISGPLVFFFTVMLTEPYTMPGTKFYQMLYFIFIAIFSSASLSMPIELYLLIGNFVPFVFLSRKRLVLNLKEKREVGKNIFEYIFNSDMKFPFRAGQYMEWIIPHAGPDERGQRRFFTMSSAPNDDLSFATKFPPTDTSSYKKTLQELKVGDKIFATQLGGDFVMPMDKNIPLILVAGGIGVTPYISMIRDMLNKKEERNITLIYLTKTPDEMAYGELLERAKTELKLKVINECDMMCNDILVSYGLDYNASHCYISGPNKMVDMVKDLLIENGCKKIHTDFFPGFA